MEQQQTEQTLLDEFISRASSVTMTNYTSFLEDVTEYTANDIFNDIDRNAIIDALAKNKNITAGKVLIKKSLSKLENESFAETRKGIEGGHGTYQLHDDGVYKLTENIDVRICSRLEVLALTRTVHSGEWGRLLEWVDLDNQLHKWAMPASLTAGDAVNVTSTLLSEGLQIRNGSAKHVLDYIMSVPTDKRVYSTNKPGWNQNSFVTPDKTYGADDFVYQSDKAITPRLAQSGTLQEWQENVSKKATGNSRLILGLCSAFAGSLLESSDVDSGGFHIHGTSSDGKSTIQKVASSVWGKPNDYMLTWRTTANGLEAIATAHNDGLLVLDELKQMSGKNDQAGQVAYMLANGQGKSRMTKTLANREPMKWRLMILSSGELTLSEKIADEGGKTFAGQEVRLCDIPSDAGANMGAFEQLHGATNPRIFADTLSRSVSQYYGIAGDVWLETLTRNDSWRNEMNEWIDNFVSKLSDGKGQQVGRVARRFALLAYTGELASRFHITDWKAGEATQAITRCFHDWLAEFGTGNRDEKRILEAVRKFIESQQTRFQKINNNGYTVPVRDCVGFITHDEMDIDNPDNHQVIWVLASQVKELAADYTPCQIKEALLNAGWITSKTSERKRFSGTQSRVFKINLPDD